MRVFLIAIAAALCLAAQFRTTSTLVLAPTTITDASGKLVDGLHAEDLVLYDNNVAQPVQVEEAFNPLSLIVAIQTSSNSAANLDKLGDSGILFSHLVAGDRGHTALLAYSDSATLISDFTTSPERLANRLRAIHPDGDRSATLDAVMDAVARLSKRPSTHRRVLLVIGESRDRNSKMHLKEVEQAAQRQNVQVYWMAYSPFLSDFTTRPKTIHSVDRSVDGTPVPPTVAPGSLLNVFTELGRQTKTDAAAELCRITGGRTIHYVKKDALEEGIQAIGAEIHQQYLVSFQPPASAPGKYHKIRIEVKNRPELQVRTRAGYWTVQQ